MKKGKKIRFFLPETLDDPLKLVLFGRGTGRCSGITERITKRQYQKGKYNTYEIHGAILFILLRLYYIVIIMLIIITLS